MKYFTAILLVCFLWACNTAGPSAKEGVSATDTIISHEHHAEAPAQLYLNGNTKWKADVSTNVNVKALQDMADAFGKTDTPGMAEYQQVVVNLQSGLDKMIRECRMKGADHDALHQWLEPLLKQVKRLASEKEVNEAKASFDQVHQQLALYNTYFE